MIVTKFAPCLLLLTACGGAETEARVPVAHERPEDEILRIGKSWESSTQNKGFRSPPSPISMFTETSTSVLTLTPGAVTAVESLTYEGSFEVRGATYRCQARADVRVAVVYGRHADEAAVEVRRPAVEIPRTCDAPGFPEPILELDAKAARFALRGDRLVPFAPPTEKRSYLPAP
ncbi:MAG TPA: hypothetical protein VHU80_20620 [Polyangiaceae bacterium]|nr:hypothetical protein [Polyangiaceae bacterium]